MNNSGLRLLTTGGGGWKEKRYNQMWFFWLGRCPKLALSNGGSERPCWEHVTNFAGGGAVGAFSSPRLVFNFHAPASGHLEFTLHSEVISRQSFPGFVMIQAGSPFLGYMSLPLGDTFLLSSVTLFTPLHYSQECRTPAPVTPVSGDTHPSLLVVIYSGREACPPFPRGETWGPLTCWHQPFPASTLRPLRWAFSYRLQKRFSLPSCACPAEVLLIFDSRMWE